MTQNIQQTHGVSLQHVRQMASQGHHVLRLDQRKSKKQMIQLMAELQRDPNVLSVEEDILLKPNFVPNDQFYNLQWHYFEATGGMNAETAWDTNDGTGVVVAVIDTGYVTHSDLDANILPGYDFIGDTAVSVDGDGRDNDPSDPGDWASAGDCGPGEPATNSSWHGTHVAGTIAALTDNTQGVAGVAYDSRVVPVRALGKCGGYTSDIADGIIWASGGSVPGVPANNNPAKVINMSLGGGGSCGSVSQNAIDTARANGAVIVVAAGNSNSMHLVLLQRVVMGLSMLQQPIVRVIEQAIRISVRVLMSLRRVEKLVQQRLMVSPIHLMRVLSHLERKTMFIFKEPVWQHLMLLERPHC